ncbi:MAG: hypothetical protein L6W00_15190 [Lentisphaeria bacterium]|nr:MAG: hypothetical protein L6W00_15190 [Lentisphaeria bacterium]
MAILPRPFSRGHRDPANLPMVLLTLDREADGKRAVRFGCEGKLDFTPERKVLYDAGDWRDDVVYRFALSLDGELVSGTIRDEGGKVLYQAELRGSGFPRVFRTAYPGFADLRQEGGDPEIPGGKQWADRQRGSADSPDVSVADRVRWYGKECTSDSRSRLDIGKLAGGHKLGAPRDHLL